PMSSSRRCWCNERRRARTSEEGVGGRMADPAVEDDKLAAEWAAMSEESPAEGGEVGTARVLNQNEIDSLLGFGGGDGDGRDTSGIRAIIDSALVSYERLPMLEVVFDRLVRMMTTSL